MSASTDGIISRHLNGIIKLAANIITIKNAKIAVSSPTSTAPKMPTVLSPAISKVNTAKTIPITTLAIIAVMAHLLPRLQFVPHIIFHPYIYYEKVTSVVKTTQNTVYKY